MPDADLLPVLKGDFLGVVEESAQLRLIDVPVSGHEHVFDVSSDAAYPSRATSPFSVQTGGTMLTAAHAIKAHLTRPVRFKLHHTYMDPESIIRNVTLSTSNGISSFDTIYPIAVKVAIENVTIQTNGTAGRCHDQHIFDKQLPLLTALKQFFFEVLYILSNLKCNSIT